mmetsp:Transcript_2442/g.5186  ORF Transcript_2442/g.5186 Transcript_2442/m.5186 type:complete len:349 (-) Transcript_2442:40-1086(-)
MMTLSFRVLNPRLVDEYPIDWQDVCYRAYKQYPEIKCADLPPNRWRFLGTWFLSPERHFQEWVGFILVGAMIVALVGPKLGRIDEVNDRASTSNSTGTSQLLYPKLWVKVATFSLYPYVAWTKLHWEGSNYPGRWLLFVGMPVGTLWIMSAGFSFISPWKCVDFRNRLLQTWLSFLPSLFPVLQSLVNDVSSVLRNGGNDVWDILYNMAYMCHVLYLFLVPLAYVFCGELSMRPAMLFGSQKAESSGIGSTLRLPIEWVMWQAVGNAIASIYYVGIITPASIYAGLNVNAMLMPYRANAGQSYRIHDMLWWFAYGCGIRFLFFIVELIIEAVRSRFSSRETREIKRKE